MAVSHQSSVQDQMADVTECSICTEVYTNPKILPCVHTFCLKCLEKYGAEKKTGDKMACPICRGEFFIPDGGFCCLPNNFFIDKMVEIRKFSETSTIVARCGICPDEEGIMAKMFCLECQLNLCERCVTAHRKIKLCQNHQVVEIGNKLKPQEVNFRSSYCDHHPGEIVKMYCEDDKATICFLCFAESHQTHKCLSVAKASEEFSSAIRNDFKRVKERLPEFQTALDQSDQLEKDLLAQIIDAETQIVDEAVKLKALIDSHASILMQKLISVKDKRLKAIESMREDAQRFKVSLESFAKYSEELLSKGAPGDICRESNQLKTRAGHLVSMTTHCIPADFSCCDRVIFKPFNFADLLRMKQIANVIGNVHEDSMIDHAALMTVAHDAENDERERRKNKISETITSLKPHQIALVRAEEFKGRLKQKHPDIEFEVKQTELSLCGLPDEVKKAKLFIMENLAAACQDSFGISESMSRLFSKDETKLYLTKRLLGEGISASWLCKDRGVIVYAFDDNDLTEAVNILKNAVIEGSLQLSTLFLRGDLRQSVLWKNFIECLCKEDELVEVSVNGQYLMVTCMESSFQRIKGRIETFLAEHRELYSKFGFLIKIFQWH